MIWYQNPDIKSYEQLDALSKSEVSIGGALIIPFTIMIRPELHKYNGVYNSIYFAFHENQMDISYPARNGGPFFVWHLTHLP
mmetsp:Transcript_17784/g.20553  ORF Transcript_17784/g.20553 Transcript_17784/m.20553 type:complete len:82 (+) Transcript_17784:307-552(+)